MFNLKGFILGLILFMLCIFLSLIVPQIFTTINSESQNILSLVILFIGAISPFIGAMER